MSAYDWVAHRYSIPADFVGEQIERIEERDGYCHPSALVEVARDPENPMHAMFLWDDTIAAERYRAVQARRIIASIVRVDSEVPDAPAFVSVRVAGAGSYVSIARLGERSDFMQFALDEARRQLQQLRRRYGALEEFERVWAAIDELEGSRV